MTTSSSLPAVIPPAPLELIEVPIDALAKPTHPLILCDKAFITTLTNVEKEVDALKVITDAKSNQAAANLLVRLTGAGTKIEKDRKTFKQPYLDMGTRIDEVARTVQTRIEKAKNTVKAAQTAYDDEQNRLAKIAEESRLAEIKRLEAIAKLEREREDARLAEIERQAEEARSKQKFEVIDDDEPEPEATPPELTPTEKALEAVRYAPVPVVAKASGVSFKTTLVPVVVDLMALPEHFVERIAKIGAIRSTFCTGWKAEQPLPVCPGVEFQIKKEPVSTGKGAF